MMKKILKITGILAVLITLFTRCSQDDEKNKVQPIDGVEKLAAASGEHGVTLSWENSTIRSYDKVDVWYIVNGQEVSLTATVEETFNSIEIELPDAEVYKFHVQAKSSATGQLAEVQSVKGRILSFSQPQERLEEILNSLEVYGGGGGARLLWENPDDIPAIIRVDFEDGEVDLEADRLTKEYTITGLVGNRSYAIKMAMVYEDQLTTITKTVSVIPQTGYAKLRADGWEIEASSEETEAEDGYAINLLDDDPITYWKSRVSAPQAVYPHYVIIDMLEVRKVAAITVTRKFEDAINSSWDNNISLSKDGVNYGEVYRYALQSSHPNPIFTREFNRTMEGEQLYMLPEVQEARFIRFDMVRGSANRLAVFGDINVYGE